MPAPELVPHRSAMAHAILFLLLLVLGLAASCVLM